ncbi:MAG: hypothetical protein M1504_00665 [Candidatus Marsarchaeota archaeon]|nr:hypothetical protein [Candidatus Marsarchaeota archaeon]
MSVFEKIKRILDEQNIEYRLTEHEPVRTSEEAARIRGVDLRTGAKAMVLKANDNYFLFVMPGNKRIDWKKAKQLLGVKEVRFATEDEAERITGVKMGSVPPFGNVLGLITYFDRSLLDNEYINFNPGSTTHSIHMKSKDLAKLVDPIFYD